MLIDYDFVYFSYVSQMYNWSESEQKEGLPLHHLRVVVGYATNTCSGKQSALLIVLSAPRYYAASVAERNELLLSSAKLVC